MGWTHEPACLQGVFHGRVENRIRHPFLQASRHPATALSSGSRATGETVKSLGGRPAYRSDISHPSCRESRTVQAWTTLVDNSDVILRALLVIILAAVASGCGSDSNGETDVQSRADAETVQDEIVAWLKTDDSRERFQIHGVGIDYRNVVVVETSDFGQVKPLNKSLRKRYGDRVQAEYQPESELA